MALEYTTAQQIGLSLTSKLTATVGIFCSTFLLTELIRDHTKREGNPVKRALMGVCVFEIIDAFAHFLSGWATPAEDGWVWAIGTQGSCSFQGFLNQAAIGGPLNLVVLTYFFYMLSQRRDQTNKFVKKNEWKFHTATHTYAIGSAILLLLLGLYNNMGNGLCWIMGNPIECGNSERDYTPDLPCVRGDHAYIYGLTMFYIPLWTSIILVVYFNWKMRQTLLEQNAEEDAQWLTRQAFWYSLAFIVTWAPSTLTSIMLWFTEPAYWLQVLTVLSEPLQGFWNLLIFLRNRPDSVENLYLLFACKLQCCPEDAVDVTADVPPPTATVENATIKLDDTEDTSSSEIEFKTATVTPAVVQQAQVQPYVQQAQVQRY